LDKNLTKKKNKKIILTSEKHKKIYLFLISKNKFSNVDEKFFFLQIKVKIIYYL